MGSSENFCMTLFFFFSSRRRHTRFSRDWSSDVCSSDLQNYSWAAYSGYMVMRGHISESLLRGVLRMVGTLAGALLALGLVPLVGTSPAASGAALALVSGGALYGALASKRSYAWLFVGLTFAMVLLDKLKAPYGAV